MTRHLSLLTLIALLLTACTKTDEQQGFSISGTLHGIEQDTTLYLDALTIEGVFTIDSMRLKSKSNTFCFHAARPQNPEFYRLRCGSEVISLCIDSLEELVVDATLGHFATEYTIDGSEKCEQLRQIAQLQLRLQQDVNSIATQNGLSPVQRREAIEQLTRNYKQELISNYIAPDPASAVAYYALFQNINGTYIFNPVGNRQDIRWMAATATAWDVLYPGTPRTENLHNVALSGLANTAQRPVLQLDMSKVKETGIIDITLPDAIGQEHSLSELTGKAVLLDFTAYSLPDNNRRTLWLRDLYTKYHDRGLEIYQIGFDADRHFWSTRADALPWICVYCDEGVNADIVQLYNVQALPSIFIIDRTNTLHARGETTDDIEAEINKVLE